MKRLVPIVLIAITIKGFSQSTSIDPRSITIPRYANQAAITAAIPNASAVVGMMVYNDGLDQYAFWNGSAWVTIATGASGPALWSHNTTTNRIEANIGFPNGIEANRFTSQSSTSLASPLINAIGSTNVFLRYGRPSTTAAVFQESTAGFTLNGSSINWRYADESNPQVITNLFGYSSGTFTVNGFTKSGDEATTTTAGVTRSSPAIKTILLTGNIALNTSGTTTTVPHGLTASKIVDVKVLVSGLSNIVVSENFVDNRTTGAITGYQFSTFVDATSVNITRHPTNGANIGNGGGLVSTYRIMISYIP